jgi:hypothetical protein
LVTKRNRNVPDCSLHCATNLRVHPATCLNFSRLHPVARFVLIILCCSVFSLLFLDPQGFQGDFAEDCQDRVAGGSSLGEAASGADGCDVHGHGRVSKQDIIRFKSTAMRWQAERTRRQTKPTQRHHHSTSASRQACDYVAAPPIIHIAYDVRPM